MPNIYRSTTLRNFYIMANFMKARACQNHKRARVIFPLMHWRPCACARRAPSFPPFCCCCCYVGCTESLFWRPSAVWSKGRRKLLFKTLFLLKIISKKNLSFNIISLHKKPKILKASVLFSVASYIVSTILYYNPCITILLSLSPVWSKSLQLCDFLRLLKPPKSLCLGNCVRKSKHISYFF